MSVCAEQIRTGIRGLPQRASLKVQGIATSFMGCISNDDDVQTPLAGVTCHIPRDKMGWEERPPAPDRPDPTWPVTLPSPTFPIAVRASNWLGYDGSNASTAKDRSAGSTINAFIVPFSRQTQWPGLPDRISEIASDPFPQPHMI